VYLAGYVLSVLVYVLIMYFEIISELELLSSSFWSVFKASCKACRIGTDLSHRSHKTLKVRRGEILIILSVSGTIVAFKSNWTQIYLFALDQASVSLIINLCSDRISYFRTFVRES
jgi:hypothetical protein